jgi:hypothetical protein
MIVLTACSDTPAPQADEPRTSSPSPTTSAPGVTSKPGYCESAQGALDALHALTAGGGVIDADAQRSVDDATGVLDALAGLAPAAISEAAAALSSDLKQLAELSEADPTGAQPATRTRAQEVSRDYLMQAQRLEQLTTEACE